MLLSNARNGRLCKHAFGHGRDTRCNFAHDLYELTFLPPDRSLAWSSDPGDRWVGQQLQQERLDEIKRYYDKCIADGRLFDIPTWAHGLRWYLEPEPPAFRNQPWDFNLIGDSTMFNVTWPQDLYPRLCKRREAMNKWPDFKPKLPQNMNE